MKSRGGLDVDRRAQATFESERANAPGGSTDRTISSQWADY
jgi:hypothetical protein